MPVGDVMFNVMQAPSRHKLSFRYSLKSDPRALFDGTLVPKADFKIVQVEIMNSKDIQRSYCNTENVKVLKLQSGYEVWKKPF